MSLFLFHFFLLFLFQVVKFCIILLVFDCTCFFKYFFNNCILFVSFNLFVIFENKNTNERFRTLSTFLIYFQISNVLGTLRETFITEHGWNLEES